MALGIAQEPRMLRRGLPRVAGGEPWPPALAGEQVAALDASASVAVEEVSPVEATAPDAEPTKSEGTPVAASPASESQAAHLRAAPGLRRGLPRTPGGEPWPPAGAGAAAPADSDPAVLVGSNAATTASSSTPTAAVVSGEAPVVETLSPAGLAGEPVTSVDAAGSGVGAPNIGTSDVDGSATGAALRRGLPRVVGAEPWPPEGTVPAAAAPTPGVASSAPAVADSPEPVDASVEAPPVAAASVPAEPPVAATASAPTASADVALDRAASTAAAPSPSPSAAVATAERPLAAIPFTPAVYPGRYAFVHPAPAPEPERIGPFTRGQWAGATVVGGFGLLFAAAMAVLFVRWLISLEPLEEFLRLYPGEYHLPEGAPVGFPGWLGWQHFFNVFLMVLIIRSGLRVRTEKRPTAFWVSRRNKKAKISLNLWFHQALDILWLINGVVFIVLLFLTGQWMRVIPTSWEVFPNALSAVLQYVSLDWPTENGWVNYNSLQQLAYFATIFLAAPLAAITGYRMSGMWPKNAKTLNRIYPVEWARAVHFPVMLYFVAFIFVHVALVLSTGALRNLNHMYAAQGSTDPTAYADNWTGFWMLVASLVVIAAAWVAARPLVLAPIAKLFGNVSGR